MSKVIICGNMKGGVGKTTVALNLAIGLARHGKKVCIIDCDPQGNCTAALGYQPKMMQVTLADVFEMILNEDSIRLSEIIVHHEEGVDLVPSNMELAGVERSLVEIGNCEDILMHFMDILREVYEYIVIDTSPNLGQLTINALVAADEVLIPMESAYLPAIGIEELLMTISRIQKHLNPDLKIMGIVMTMVNPRSRYTKQIEETVKEAYGRRIHFFPNIPRSVRMEETAALGMSIYKHDPKGKAARALTLLTEEVLSYEY